MASDRIKQQIERLLDNLEEAVEQRDWQLVRQLAEDVLVLDPDNVDAPPYLSAAERALGPKQPEEPKGTIPEQDHEVPDTFSAPVDNPNPPTTPISTEEFVEPPPIIAEEFFARARARVAREEAEEAGSNSNSSVHTKSIGPIEAVTKAFTHCFDWKGRASRSEFWWFYLFVTVFHLCVMRGIFYLVGILGDNVHFNPWEKYWYLFVVESLALLTPFSFLIVRRLRDADKNILYGLLVVLYWLGWVAALNWITPFSDNSDNSIFTGILILVSGIFLFGCLPLCAMPTHNRTLAGIPVGIRKSAGLFIGRVAVGIVINGILASIGIFYFWSAINRIGDGVFVPLSLADGIIRTFLFALLELVTSNLPLVLLLMLQSRFEGRSVLEPFRIFR